VLMRLRTVIYIFHYVFVYSCVYVFMRFHARNHERAHATARGEIYISVFIHVFMCVYVFIRFHARNHERAHATAHGEIYILVCIHIFVSVCTYLYVFILGIVNVLMRLRTVRYIFHYVFVYAYVCERFYTCSYIYLGLRSTRRTSFPTRETFPGTDFKLGLTTLPARARAHTHTYTRAHTHIHTCASSGPSLQPPSLLGCARTHTYTCAHTHTRARAHTHTHTHARHGQAPTGTHRQDARGEFVGERGLSAPLASAHPSLMSCRLRRQRALSAGGHSAS